VLLRPLRHRLKAAFAGLSVRIPRGPLRGLRWSVATGLPFIRGVYEPLKSEALAEVLRPGQVVYDVGAHVGYFTAVASLEVGPGGHVIAFEPRPLNLRFLHRHVRWNNLSNVRIVEAAVGEAEGEGRFRDDLGTGTGRLTDADGLPVVVVALDTILRRGDIPPPAAIKIDIEGGELDALRGARGILREHRPVLLLATHGAEVHAKCLEILDEEGYHWQFLDATPNEAEMEMLARPGTTSDP
jgi:FkbM family methyltransferase